MTTILQTINKQVGLNNWPLIIDFVRCEPNYQACFKRLLHATIMHSDNCIRITENGKEINPEFRRILMHHYATFFKNALELAFVCGFVPFYFRKTNGILFPLCLELGTFTWRAEYTERHTDNSKRRKLTGILQYKVSLLSGSIREDEIKIFSYESPHIEHLRVQNFTRIQNLLNKYEILQSLHNMSLDNHNWNKNKHVVLTENIDLKDQTTSGIQLLDQMRRYSLVGDTGGHRESTMLYKSRNKQKINTVNDAKFVWAQDQFSEDDRAKSHILPPNMNIVELGMIPMPPELEFYVNLFQREVYTFFDQANVQDISGSRSVTGSEQVTRHQHLTILNWCTFFQNLGRTAYSHAFDVHIDTVEFEINPQSRLEINDVADIKPLVETQILTTADKRRIREILGLT